MTEIRCQGVRWWNGRDFLLRVSWYVQAIFPFPFLSTATYLGLPAIIAGLTYTAIGALTFLSRTPGTNIKPAILSPGSVEFESLVRWLVSRQTSELGDEEYDERQSDSEKVQSPQITVEGLPLEDRLASLSAISPLTDESIQWAGFNGRCNKVADTCYSFWTAATLVVRSSWKQAVRKLLC